MTVADHRTRLRDDASAARQPEAGAEVHGGPGAPRQVLLRMFAGLIVLVVFLLPYLIMFFGSVKTKAQIRSVDPTYFPTEWHWENYITMWSTPETPLRAEPDLHPRDLGLRDAARARRGAAGRLLHGAVPVPGRLVFLFLVIVTQMVQPAVLTSGLFRQFIAIGLIDTWAAMILVNAAFNLSFAVWIMHSFFASIPKEIDEAAQIDGAGTFTVLTKINLPLVWPGIVTAVVFTFVACWNEFAASL